MEDLNINNYDKLVWTDYDYNSKYTISVDIASIYIKSCYALEGKYTSVVEDYEYTLSKIPIGEIEKYLRKIKLNNISENEK